MTLRPSSAHSLLFMHPNATARTEMAAILQQRYRLLLQDNPKNIFDLAYSNRPDLILLGGPHAKQICLTLKQTPLVGHIPVILIAEQADAGEFQHGLHLGAADYLVCPHHAALILSRIETQIRLQQIEELRNTSLKIVHSLCMASRYKDDETGLHIMRMSRYAHILAVALGYGARDAEDVLHTAPIHDVGKIAIPDSILHKPGKLTPEEWQIMQQHTLVGARIIGEHHCGLMQVAHSIALNHHEKWDGSGYPNGLHADEIPHVARIVAVADVFDALTSARPYKQPWPLRQALDYIRNAAGSHFDPAIVTCFFDCLGSILETRDRWTDDSEAVQLFSHTLS